MYAPKIDVRVRSYIEHTIRNYDRHFSDKKVSRYLEDMNSMTRERLIKGMVKDICSRISEVDLVSTIDVDPNYFDDFRYEEVVSGRDEPYLKSLRDKYFDGFKLDIVDYTIRMHRDFDPFKNGQLYFTYVTKDKKLQILRIDDYEKTFNEYVRHNME